MDNSIFKSYHKDLFVNEKYVQTFKDVCNGMEERYSMKFEAVGFDEDHVHFLLQSVPEYFLSQLFGVVKSITAIKLFEAHLDIKKELWGDGGFVSTVGGGVNAEIIRKYIQNQGRKSNQLELVDFI